MFWSDELDARYAAVVNTDHPLSLGYSLKVVTTSPYADRSVRLRKPEMARVLEGVTSEGMHVVWNERRLILIAINMSATTPWSKTRLIELITHEVSHAVDGIFERCKISAVDTELRAYYNDWIVGKVLYHFPKIGK